MTDTETPADTAGEPALIDFEEVTRSINGFDEIAVSNLFGMRFAKMEDTTAARAVLFVSLRRNQGFDDKAAYREAMNLGLADLEARFQMSTGAEVLSPSAQAERDQEYAQFVVVTGLSFTPQQFLELTAGQKQAIYDETTERRR